MRTTKTSNSGFRLAVLASGHRFDHASAGTSAWLDAVDRFRLVMALFHRLLGCSGMYFHYRGSREFQLEMDPSMSGTNLIWKVLQAKSPPTLSPGTMVQMGILGLGYAYLRKGR